MRFMDCFTCVWQGGKKRGPNNNQLTFFYERLSRQDKLKTATPHPHPQLARARAHDSRAARAFLYRSLYASALFVPLFQLSCVATTLRSLRQTYLLCAQVGCVWAREYCSGVGKVWLKTPKDSCWKAGPTYTAHHKTHQSLCRSSQDFNRSSCAIQGRPYVMSCAGSGSRNSRRSAAAREDATPLLQLAAAIAGAAAALKDLPSSASIAVGCVCACCPAEGCVRGRASAAKTFRSLPRACHALSALLRAWLVCRVAY